MTTKTIVGRCRKYGSATILWVAFSFGCIVAPFMAIALLIPRIRRIPYMMNFVKAADRMTAAELGFSGRFMLSTECAHAPCLQRLRDILNEIEENHCESSAYEEGVYCKISDHTIGYK